MTDTIFALSSGRPPAAIAVIRISGPHAHAAAEALCGPLPAARQASVRSLRDPTDGQLLDEALVVRFDGPTSFTAEDCVELQCHGGRAVVDAVLGALGGMEEMRAAEAGEFTRRALLNGRLDLTEAEGLADLLEAETEAQRRAALAMAGGGLRAKIDEWRERLLGLSAQAELAIDYVGEEEELASGALKDELALLAFDLTSFLARPRAEPLKDGIRVVLAGPTNSGKSSLLNALVGYDRAIVTDREGTTRDHLEVPLAIAGIPFVLTDTAGLRVSSDLIEVEGIERSLGLISRADIVLWLGEPDLVPDARRAIPVRAKADINEAKSREDRRLAVSAATGEGIGDLLDCLSREAAAILPINDELALNRRQASLLTEAAAAIKLAESNADPVLTSEQLRLARESFERLTGRAGVEDLLDSLFSRFCLGK